MNQPSGNHLPLLISFSGIDGAGKSTQISLLRGALRRKGLRVELITFWDDVVALKCFRENLGHTVFQGDKGVGSPDAPIERRDKNVQSPILTICRMGLYALDVHSLCRAVRAIRRKKPGAGVILCDRFIYDELANLKPDNAFTRLFVATILRLAPTPDLSLVLDADPDAAFARKPEYPLEFLHSNRNAYLNLARVASLTVIPAAPIDEAHAEILRHVQQKRTTATSFDDAEQTLNREHLCCADTADQRP